MQNHDWVLDVLTDLQAYANENELYELSVTIGEAAATAACELEIVTDYGRASEAARRPVQKGWKSAVIITFPRKLVLPEAPEKSEHAGNKYTICK